MRNERLRNLSENDTKVISGKTDNEVITDTVRLLIHAQKDDTVARAEVIKAQMMPLPGTTKSYDEVLRRACQHIKRLIIEPAQRRTSHQKSDHITGTYGNQQGFATKQETKP